MSFTRHGRKHLSKPRTIAIAATGLLAIAALLNLGKADLEITDGPKNAPATRRDWLRMRHANADGNIEHGALLNAKREMDRLAEAQRADPRIQAQMKANKDAGIWLWEWLGPGNIGGRVETILTHPTEGQILYTAGVTGGIWKSTSWGGNWTPKSDFISSLAVRSLAMDPTNSDVLYAGTGGENGDGIPAAGVFRSLDAGESWSQLSSTGNSDFGDVMHLAHHPTQAGHLFAGTSTGVYESTDSGNTWSESLGAGSVRDIEIHPTIPDRMMVGTDTNAYTSHDGGANWTRVTDGVHGIPGPGPGRCEVEIFDGIDNWMYIALNRSGGELWWSMNAGQTWSLRSVGVNWFMAGEINVGGWASALWVSPLNGSLVVVGGLDLWRSFDGGLSFARISDWTKYITGQSAHADQQIIVEDSGFNGTTNNVVFFGNDGGIQMANIETVGPTSGWINLANNLGVTQFFGGSASTNGLTIAGGAMDNGTVRYRPNDGPQGWFQGNGGDGGPTAVHPTNPNIVYAQSQFLDVVKSVDGGHTFAPAINGLTEAGTSSAPMIAQLVMDRNNPQTLYAGGKLVWKTTDGAANWNAIRPINASGTQVGAIDVALGDPSLVWVGYLDGEIAKRNPNGSWTVVEQTGGAGAMPWTYVSDIAISPFNDDEVFVTLGGVGFEHVWYTADGGNSWESRDGTGNFTIPDLPVNSVRFHPTNPNWVYLGTALGVLASEDKGIHWSVIPRLGDNEGPVNTAVNELFWQGNYLIAATWGRGMYRTLPLNVSTANLIVTNTGDSGPGTLRWAIESANANATPDIISFDIPGSGTHTIPLQSALPFVSTQTVIDGSTQPGWSANTKLNEFGFDAILPIRIDGSGLFHGLRLTSPGSSVVGLDFRNCVAGVLVQADSVSVSGCRMNNCEKGVTVNANEADVGGRTALVRNSMENCETGIRINGGLANEFRGNRIQGSSVLGIDLSPTGVTPNDFMDADAGPNGRVNYPTLLSAELVVGGLHVTGSMDGQRADQYEVDFYASTACHATGFGEADAYLASAIFVPGPAGTIPIDIVLPVSVADGDVISATATMAAEGTSEFSNCVAVQFHPWSSVTGSSALNNTGTAYGASWADFDGDGDDDLYVANANSANQLLRNDGSGIFVDATPPILAHNGDGRVGVWGDMDNDGDPDLYLSNEDQANHLYRNDGGGVFVDVTTDALRSTDNSRSAAWVDVENDGDLDLYLTVSGGSNLLFVNDGMGGMIENTPVELADSGGDVAVAWGDYDDDGDQDAYLVRRGTFQNRMIRNDGNLIFVDATVAPLDNGDNGRGAAWGDYDNDGDLDLYLANGDAPNKLFRNFGGGAFGDVTVGVLGDAGPSRSVAWVDFENDGDLDLYIVSAGAPNLLLQNDGGGAFSDAADTVIGDAGLGIGAAWADYDGDGDLDVFVAKDGKNVLIRNDQIVNHHWLQLRLKGTLSNDSAVGARVRVVAGSLSQIRELTAGSGYLSQNTLMASFGLAGNTGVDLVEITWPSGIVNSYTDGIVVDQALVVGESQGGATASESPTLARLVGAVPNPFNPRTTIQFELAQAESVRLEIYDARGRLVRTLLRGVRLGRGNHYKQWRGRDNSGQIVASGVYHARLLTPSYSASISIVLVR